MNAAAVYTRFEILRSFRNGRFAFFSVVFPVVLYFVHRRTHPQVRSFGDSGISAPLYYMVGLVSFGTMVGDDLRRRPDRRRADHGMDPAAADHPALAPAPTSARRCSPPT